MCGVEIQREVVKDREKRKSRKEKLGAGNTPSAQEKYGG